MSNKLNNSLHTNRNKKFVVVATLSICLLMLFVSDLGKTNNNNDTNSLNQHSQNPTVTIMPVISTQTLQSPSNPTAMAPKLQQGSVPFTNTQSKPITKSASSSLPTSPTPTQLISPTNTPQPSFTSTSQPLGFFTGTGNQVVDINSWQEPLIISFFYNSEGVSKVLSRDTSGELVGTLIDATGSYEGRQIINTGGVQYGSIEIQTTGSWQMEFQSLDSATPLALPVTINGKNAEVYQLDKMIYELDFDASDASGWVSLIGYGENNYINVIINEQAPFSKTIEVKDPDILYLEILSLGEWILEIK